MLAFGDGWISEELADRKVRKKDLPVRKEFEYNPRFSFSQFNPYDVAFCYPHPLYDRPFIVKGGHQAIRKYLKELDVPMVVHHTLYQKGRHRILYGFYGLDKGIQISKRYNFNKATHRYIADTYYELAKFNFGSGEPKKLLAQFKRVPRRWIRELNLYVEIERRSFRNGSISGKRKS